MSSLDLNAALEAAADASVQKRAAELRRPVFVNQRTIENVVGMAAVDFLEHARLGAFPSWKERRVVYARTADVVAFIEAHPVVPKTETETGEAAVLAMVGARRLA
jgi:hypothetical protein